MDKPEVSQRRIDANRRNALRSTGPRTAEGKEKSRRNSLIHGLSGAGVVMPEGEEQAARERAEQWNSSLRPMNAFEMGLVETIAVESVRIDRCRIEERLVRDIRARRAGACWIDERRAEVAKLGQSLGSQPEEIAARLSSTAAGCDWLMIRWRALGKTLDKKGGWTDEQASLALDLMGVAADIRAMDSPLEAPEFVDTLAHLRDLVEFEMEVIAARQEQALDAIDDDLREATSMGLIATDDPTLVLLRRYETASFRRQKWALDMLHRGRQRVEPIPSMTHDYRERPRQAPHVREEAAPVPTSEGPTPPPAPEPPARGPATGRDRQQPGPVQQAGRVQPAPPGPFAGRDLLAGHMLRLARSLAAPRTARRSPRLSSKPGRRMSRPTPATSRPARAGMLRLVAAPAA